VNCVQFPADGGPRWPVFRRRRAAPPSAARRSVVGPVTDGVEPAKLDEYLLTAWTDTNLAARYTERCDCTNKRMRSAVVGSLCTMLKANLLELQRL
jgi:hypothetical protein